MKVKYVLELKETYIPIYAASTYSGIITKLLTKLY